MVDLLGTFIPKEVGTAHLKGPGTAFFRYIKREMEDVPA